MNVQSYLFFDGCCEEAIGFYTIAFHATVEFLMRYEQGPKELMPDGWGQKIFHATMRIGETLIQLADDASADRVSHRGFAMLVHADSDEDAKAMFGVLEKDGKVIVPLDKSFWAALYGVVTDRFGVTWKIQLNFPDPS